MYSTKQYKYLLIIKYLLLLDAGTHVIFFIPFYYVADYDISEMNLISFTKI